MMAGALIALLAASFLIWWLFNRAPQNEGEAVQRRPNDPAAAAWGSARANRTAPPADAAKSPKPPSPYGEYDLPIMGPGPDDHPDGPAHPHPITPEHIRIHGENFLIAALYDALDARNFAEMRRLIVQYQQRYPEDSNKMREGFQVMADCLEVPGPDSRAVAQRYYDAERASTLRRLVRRHCLEPGGN